jgi:hypothetical protein
VRDEDCLLTPAGKWGGQRLEPRPRIRESVDLADTGNGGQPHSGGLVEQSVRARQP